MTSEIIELKEIIYKKVNKIDSILEIGENIIGKDLYRDYWIQKKTLINILAIIDKKY